MMATNAELRSAAELYRNISADIADAMEGFCSATELTTLLYRLAEITRPMQSHILATVTADDDEPVSREKVLAIPGARILGPSRYAIQPGSPSYILVDMSEQADGVPVELAVCDPHTGSHVTVAWGPTMKNVHGLVESLSTKLKGGA